MPNKRGYSTKTEMVYEKIRVDIVTGILKQGEKIVAREVSKDLGVSDIPVREALKKLESVGLVENIPHRGSRVSAINIQKAEEIFAIRLELETFATRLAGENANAEEIDELQKIVDQINEVINEKEDTDLKKLSTLNSKFHHRLYQMSGNEALCELIFSLMDRSQFSQSVFSYLPDRRKHSNEEHQDIINALRKGNAKEAELVLKTQKEYSFAALLNKLITEIKGEERVSV